MELRGSVEYNLQLALESSGFFGVIPFTATSSLSGRDREARARRADYLEAELSDRDWFAGDQFTAADVMMSFPLEIARLRAGLDGSRPRLSRWLDRIHTTRLRPTPD